MIRDLHRTLASLDRTTFDVVIVGGGISGACIAHDAALRGLAVALVDQDDFGGATSSASSKILHGGIRHLQQLRFDKVRESLRERDRLRRIAPHLVQWVPFLTPAGATLRRGRGPLAGAFGLYASLGGTAEPRDRVRMPTGTYLDRRALGRVAPALTEATDFAGAFVLNECHLHSSERMTLAFVKTAAANGAVVANYVTVDGLLRAGRRVVGVRARDVESGADFPIRARVTVNAAGPWLAAMNDRFAAGALRRPVTGLALGAHVVTRQLHADFAMALPTPRASRVVVGRGGRHVFVIPWRGHSLIGTSNRPFDGHADFVRPTDGDVAELLQDVNQALPSARLVRADVRHAFAGLYPLTARRLAPEVYQGIADYQIVDHGRSGGPDGFVSALGAKYTTARALAERATTVVCAKLGHRRMPCRTGETPLVGGDLADPPALRRRILSRCGERVASGTADALMRSFGSEARDVLGDVGRDASASCRLAPGRDTVEAEIRFAVRREMARQLADVVFRRTGLGTLGHPGDGCLDRCAAIMADELGWTAAHRAEQLRRTRALFGVPLPR